MSTPKPTSALYATAAGIYAHAAAVLRERRALTTAEREQIARLLDHVQREAVANRDAFAAEERERR